MEMATSAALDLGLKSDHIHKESFSASIEPGKQTSSDELDTSNLGTTFVFTEALPDEFNKEETETIEAVIDGDPIQAKPDDDDDNLLESLLNAGQSPPFSCMSGSCSACMCQLDEGYVFQEDPGILSEDEIKQGKFLSCQAIGVSKNLKFTFLE